jgi:recombination protein RecT
MNKTAIIEKPTRLETFRMEVLPPDRKADLYASLPAHVRPEVFERNLVNALMSNPDLMDLDPRLVFREVSKAAALGLYLDPQLGEAYLIAGWNGKAKRTEPQLRIGYRGLVKLGRQSGEIKMIYAHEVHENDSFECVLGDNKTLMHKPDVFGDRGKIIGYYAVVRYVDGETDFEPMTVNQIHDIRDRSDGWKAYINKKIKSTPWSTDEVEMAKKTVIRRLTKRIPQSPEMAEAIKIEDAAEHSEFRNIPVPKMMPPSPPSPPAAPKAIASPPNIPVASKLAPSPLFDENGKPEMPDFLDRRKQVDEMPDDSNMPIADFEAFLGDLEGQFAAVNDKDTLDEIWVIAVEPHIDADAIFPGDLDRLNEAYRRHLDRVR